ncbi:hypothetical protein [Acidocella sp. C78]|uniref:hypothetical protein n=1 Tax=Acidocella sp. C78 TaxID=1671486 RepID=UPI001BD682D5|nr:hypothetical protein [Acidocella sp. C78]
MSRMANDAPDNSRPNETTTASNEKFHFRSGISSKINEAGNPARSNVKNYRQFENILTAEED